MACYRDSFTFFMVTVLFSAFNRNVVFRMCLFKAFMLAAFHFYFQAGGPVYKNSLCLVHHPWFCPPVVITGMADI
jgi:hypothetical protein